MMGQTVFRWWRRHASRPTLALCRRFLISERALPAPDPFDLERF
jgi:hypothetical protein